MKYCYAYLVLLVSLFLPASALADSVSVEEAHAKAVRFFTGSVETRTAPQLELVWDGEPATTRSGAEPAFYIFNRNDNPGFVIIAGDDAASPVIGYSLKNNFSSTAMPDNLRWWLDGVRETILEMRKAGVAAHPDQRLAAADAEKLLATAEWGQGDPYNRECPMLLDGVTRTVTGCVQTAAAIICKYHRWPTEVSGTVPGYTTATKKLSVPSRTLRGYNFDLMPMNYRNFNESQAAEIARLMADLGVMMQADYDTSTGAYSEDVPIMLSTYMRFSKQALHLSRTAYTDEEWITLLKKEIDANRPALYSGSDITAGGHAFVMDGYDSNNKIHFNWGWDGSANGYYDVAFMNPKDTPYRFTQYQGCVVNLQPDPNGTSTYVDLLMVASSSNASGLTTKATSFTPGSSFQATFAVFNLGNTAYTGETCLAHFAEDGTKKADVSSKYTWRMVSPMQGYVLNVNCTLTEPIVAGDYVAGIFYERSSKEWQTVRSYDGSPWRIVLRAANPKPHELLQATTMTFDKKSRSLGFTGYVGMTVKLLAPDGSEVASATFDKEPVTFDCSKLAAGKYTVAISYDVVSATFNVVF